MLLSGQESWKRFISDMSCTKCSKASSICIPDSWSIEIWNPQISCLTLIALLSWLISGLQDPWLQLISQFQNRLWLSMWLHVGTELLKYCLDHQNTPKLSICGQSDAFWVNYILVRPFSLEIQLLINFRESLNCSESLQGSKSSQWNQ